MPNTTKKEMGQMLSNMALIDTKYNYTFKNHFHPFVGRLIEKSNKGEIKDVLTADLTIEEELFFESTYDVLEVNEPDLKISINSFPKKIDFDVDGAYSIYNWEIFFHLPLSIAVQLSKNQRFEDAQKWFHFIFNPLTDELPDPANPMGRYWNFAYFRENGDLDSITEMLESLSAPTGDQVTEQMKAMLRKSIAAWKKNPFTPHTVAKFRPLAYKYNVVMKYLDNLLDWGDSLFRQFTMESLNVGTQIYLLASGILGERPQEIPRLKKRVVRTYRQLKNDLDEFGNALVEVENDLPLNSNISSSEVLGSTRSKSLLGLGKQLYFCIPKNDKLLEYWDKVEDRLAKIRHCMDIEGNIRPLPLFQPSIDMGLLGKAGAFGLDLSSLITGLNTPISNVRFRVIYQKALEMCNELRGMGKDYLNAIEKSENEKLMLMRQSHEIKMNDLINDIKYLRWKEAEESTEALLMARQSTFNRYKHYQRLLGNKEGDFEDLAEIVIDRSRITEENFDEVHNNLVEQYAGEIDLEEYREEKLGLLGEAASGTPAIGEAISSIAGVGGSSHLGLNKTEDIELNVFMPASSALNNLSAAVGTSGISLALIPQFFGYASPMGTGMATHLGGENLSKVADVASGILAMGGKIMADAASRSAKLAIYQNRIDERVQQSNEASQELQRVGRDLIGRLINEQALKKDYENHQELKEQSLAIEDYLQNEKFTNEELYLWMQGEVSRLYFDCYNIAYDTAKKAEVTLKHELMRPEIDERNFIKFNYRDAGRRGLLSGESLLLDLKRMDLAYLENNKREFELVKHVSLKRLNPLALLQMKTNGSCEFNIPEWCFDLGCPGHYMRRIKSVSLSIPCVVGPYTSINCTMSLQKSTIRKSALLSDGDYQRGEDDDRFQDNYGAVQSIVTSNAQNDSGLFEVNLLDERFLPFEGAGAESKWKLSLPSDLREFNFYSISDIIMHFRYTARQGGELLATGATEWITENLAADEEGSVHSFSLEHDFPNEWHQFINATSGDLKITVTKDHLPYLVSSRDLEVKVDETQLYEIGEDELNVILDPFAGLTSAFSVAGDNTRKEITIKRASIEGKDKVVLLLTYGI